MLVLLLSVFTLRVSAQGLEAYYFSTGTDSTKWIPLSTTTSLLATTGDGVASSVQDLGFTFNFAGNNYTQFSVNSDGNFRFGSVVTATNNYSTPFSATASVVNNPKINMLGCDGYRDVNNYVRHEVVGTEPNRVAVIEFAASTYNTTSRPAILKWQIQLFEGSNNIQIVYASTAPSMMPNVDRQPGMCVDNTEIILLDNNHIASFYEEGQSANSCPIGNWPDVNRYYLFEPYTITCPKPTSVIVNTSSITQTSIDLSWTENGSAMEWEVEYGPAGFVKGTGTRVQAFNTSATIDNLIPSTPYDFYVRAVCGIDDTSNYSKKAYASTACGMISQFPYIQNFDSYTGSTSGSSTNLPLACWTQYNTGYNYSSASYSGYPIIYNSASYSNSGTNSLRFYSYVSGTSSYGNQYAATPVIDVATTPINTLQVDLKVRRYSSSYPFTCIVGVMGDSLNTITPVDTISLTSEDVYNVYQDRTIFLNRYEGNGNRIVFYTLAPSTSYNAGHIDDIVISVASSCLKPTGVNFSQITDNSVTIDWTLSGDESAWDISVVEAGDPMDESAVEYVSEHPYTFTGLEANTTYDVYVRANCGSEVSDWSTVASFTTRCVAVTTLPYVENFDGVPAASAVSSGVIPDCWDRTTNYSSNYPYVYSTNHASGTGALYFYSTSAYYSAAASQALDLSQYGAGSLMLSFKAMRTATTAGYGRLQVGLMTDPADFSTFTLLKDLNTADYPSAGEWFDFNVMLPGQYDDPVYLAFYAPAEATSYALIDDIVLDEVPSCMAPNNVNVSNINGVSAQVNWTPTVIPPESYSVEYSEAGLESWSTPELVSGNSFILTNLSPMTKYDVRVSANCASDYSEPVTVSFQTVCLIPEDVAIGTGTSTSSYVPFYTVYQYGYSQQLFTTSEMGSDEMEIATISFQYGGNASVTKNIDVYLENTMASNVSTWVPMDNAQLVYSGPVTFRSNASDNGWNTIVLDSVFQYNGFSNLLLAVYTHNEVSNGSISTDRTFKAHSATGMARYLTNTSTTTYNPLDVMSLAAGTASSYRSNVRFGNCNVNTSCAPPTLHVDDVTDNAVELSWIPGYQETSWILEYRLANADEWTNIGEVYTTSYTINDLMSDVDYQVRIAALCGDTSTWVVDNIHTLCPFVGLPFTEDFETATGSGAGNFVSCWTRATSSSTQYPYTYSTYSHSGNYSAYFYATTAYYSYAATPRLADDVQMDSLQIRFWLRKTSASYFIEVGLMSNPNDYSTFEVLGNFTPDTVSTWREFELTTRGYQGNGHCVAFRCPATASTYMCVDDIIVQYIPSCERVSEVHTADVTAHTADVVWTPGADQSAWYYVYGLKDSVDLETASPEYVTDTVVHLLNLLANTEYDIYVQAACDNGENADYVKYTFRTDCDPVTHLPFMDNFDTYGGSGSAYFPSCWNRYYASSATSLVSTSYPYVYSSNTNTPPGCLYFYNLTSTAGTFSMAVLPEFDASIQLNTLQVDCNIYTTSANYYLLVGAMTDPTDLSSFVVIDTLKPSTISTHEQVSALLTSYSGNGHYIAFKGNGYVYMDDLVIDRAPACDAPTDMVISNVSQTEATVAWAEGSVETSWELYVVTSGASLEGVAPTVVNSNDYLLTGLQPGTSYDVFVRAICLDNTGFSTYLLGSFETECNPMTELPYFDNFDSYTGVTTGTINNLPNCWNYLNDGTGSSYMGYPVIYNSSSYAQSGPNALRFYTGTASTYGDQYAILPSIDTVVYPVNTLQVAFDAAKYSTSYNEFTVVVGVISNPASAATFIPVDTVHVMETTHSHHVVYLNHYEGSNGRICFYVPKNSSGAINSGTIDNLEISLAPSCFVVSNVQAVDVEQTEITLDWTPNGNETGWNVEYKLSIDTVWNVESASAHPMTVQGLLPGTEYDFRVQADCGSEYSNILTVSTECSDLVQLPYTENFDSYTASTSGTVVNLPNCWHQIHLGWTSSTYKAYPIMYNSSSYAQSGSNSLRFYTYTATGDQWAVMRSIDTLTYPIQSLQMTLSAREYSTSYPFELVIGVMSDFRDTSTFVPVQTISPTGTTYEDFTVYFRDYVGGGKYIAMVAKKPNSSYNTGNVDDITISVAPNCFPVSDLVATTVNTNDITVEWTPNGSETDWVVEYRSETDDDWNQVFASTTPSATAQGLTPATYYSFRVKADCGNSEYSAWSDILIARTSCSTMTLPFEESFDSIPGVTTGTVNNLPDCWNNLSGTYSSYAGYPIVYNSSSYAYNGNNSLRFYTGTTTSTDYGDQYAILPPIDVTTNPINTLQLSFKARKYTSTYATFTLVVGVMGNAENAATFVPVDTIEVTDLTYGDYMVYLSSYTGQGNRIALLAPRQTSVAYNEGHVDYIRLETISGCPAPRGLNAVTNTTSSVTLGWIENGSATQWNIEYGPAGFTQGSGTVVPASTNPFTITGLTPSTNYTFYVQAVCGDDETSAWSTDYTVATACDVMSLPYTENFDSYIGTTYSAAGPIPLCWTTTMNNTTYPAPHIVGSGSYCYPHSGANCMVFTSGAAGADAYAVLPSFDRPLNTMHLNFYRRMENATNGTLTVGYVTSSANMSTFVVVATIPSLTTGDTISVDFTGADIPANGMIAFHWNYTTSFYSCCIDDINVTSDAPVNPCNAPTNVAASNVLQNTATITWTAGGDETAWNLQYKAAADADWSSNIAVSNTPSYALNGLTANTAYMVRVQAACDEDNVSNWTDGSFTTLEEDVPTCPAPTNVAASNITKNAAVITWDQEANTASSWTVQYKQTVASAWETATANAMTYTLNGLNDNTQYDVQVIANCDNGLTSDPSQTIQFTTLIDGVNEYVLDAAINVYPNPTSGQFTISNEQCTIYNVEVYDVYGKLINTTKVEDTQVTLDINTCADGVYFARILTDKGVVTKRIVKK